MTVVPFPYRAVTKLRNRAGAQPIAVSVLGHQRLEKGYAELPEILSLLLQSRPLLRRARPDIRLFVQAASIRDPSNSEHAAQAELARRSRCAAARPSPTATLG